MSDFSDQEYDEDDGPPGLRKHAKDLEAKASAAEARASALERELAFAKAGLDLSDPKMSYFVKGYDGEADPEKIRAAATEAGFIGSTEPANTIPAAELAQHQAAANLAAGASNDTFTGTYYDNPQYQQDMRLARTPEEVLAKVRAAGGALIDELDY